MKKTVFIVSLICFKQLSAQVCFSPVSSYSVGHNPTSIATADYNGDGNKDLVVANGINGFGLLLGDGAGNFGAATTFTTPSNPSQLINGDFNNDSKADVAISNGLHNVSIFLGDGAGSFAAPITDTVLGYANAVVTEDFNGDGNTDIAVTNGSNNSSVAILLGDGTGNFNFSTAASFTTGTTPLSIVAKDFNNDGKIDLATANYNASSVSILLGDGTGNFYYGITSAFPTDAGPYSITSTDFNGDGKADLATANESHSTVSVLIGNGTGNFWQLTNYSSGGSFAWAISSNDFNNDGKMDIAAVNFTSSNVGILLGDGAGTMGNVSTYGVSTSTATAIYNPTAILASDFNNDGKADIALTSTSATNTTAINAVDVMLSCTSTPTCVATIADSMYQDASVASTWIVVPKYSAQVNDAVWYWGDGTSSRGLYPSHTYASNNWYQICGTAYTSCGDSASTCRDDSVYRYTANAASMVQINLLPNNPNTTGISASNTQQNISIYPNPAQNNFTIETNVSDKQTLQVFDVNGKLVLTQTINNTTNIDVSILAQGVYNVSLTGNNGVINKRLVIVK